MKYFLICYNKGVPPMKLMFDFVDYNVGKTLVLHANTKNMKMAVLKVRVFENHLFRKLTSTQLLATVTIMCCNDELNSTMS